MSRRLQTLAALAVGCAAGWVLCSVSGCALVFLATARADGPAPAAGAIIAETCGADGYAVVSFPGSTAYELADSVHSIGGLTANYQIRGTAFTSSENMLGSVFVADGAVAIGCQPGGTVRLYVRQ